MKKILVIFIFCIITFSFSIYTDICISASKKGIMLWYSQIFPVLFPCIIVSNILLASNLLENVKKAIPFLIIACGILCGFPIGSKLSCDFYKKKMIKKETAQLLCNYSNHFSLAYISGYVIANCIDLNKYNVFVIYLLIYLPSILILIINVPSFVTSEKKAKKSASRFKINMQIIDAGIINGFETLIKLCGYIVLISIIVELIIAQFDNIYIKYFLVGIIENTNGISQLINSKLASSSKMILSVGYVSFGGISCILQTASIMKDTDLSIKKYINAKIFTSIVSIILTIVYLFSIRFC